MEKTFLKRWTDPITVLEEVQRMKKFSKKFWRMT